VQSAGIQIVGISYDAVEVLKRAATKLGVTFPLLSDAGSKTIDAYGVRNREANGTRAEGIPHPTTFVVDQTGIIRAKLFLDGYRERSTSADLIKTAKTITEASSKQEKK
jgi:peroxiredoxin